MTEIASSLVLVVLTVVVGIAYEFRRRRWGPARHERVDRQGASFLLRRSAMEMGYWIVEPMARGAMRLGASANAVSWLSLALGATAGVALGVGRFGSGAALSLASSACDAVDGFIARAKGTANAAGEVLDASIDRYAELFFFGGVAFYERTRPLTLLLTLAALSGALMVSYSTAKAEALHVKPPGGAMRRPERAVILVVGTALMPVAHIAVTHLRLPLSVQQVPLVTTMGLVAVVGNVSAVKRLRAVAHQVRDPSRTRSQENTSRPKRGGAPAPAGDNAIR